MLTMSDVEILFGGIEILRQLQNDLAGQTADVSQQPGNPCAEYGMIKRHGIWLARFGLLIRVDKYWLQSTNSRIGNHHRCILAFRLHIVSRSK